MAGTPTASTSCDWAWNRAQVVYALIFSPDGDVHEISLDVHFQNAQIWLMQLDTVRHEPESVVKVLYGLVKMLYSLVKVLWP